VTPLRSLLPSLAPLAPFAFAAAVVAASLASPRTASADSGISSLSTSPVTVYGAKWCSACRTLEGGLKDRKIAFEVIDVDDNPTAFARARASSGASNAIPLTSITRSSNTVWVVGSDIDAVDRAQRGE
jgi:mycoredoxin